MSYKIFESLSRIQCAKSASETSFPLFARGKYERDHPPAPSPPTQRESLMSAIHHLILTLLFVVIGCCVGSFVNVCASRIPRGLSIVRPRSRCPQCRTAILGRDNIPIFGWLLLHGRCRACGTAIPLRYLLVELAMGLAFAGVYLASVFAAPGDLWEQQGAASVLGRLLIVWTATSVVVGTVLTALDVRARSV